MIGQTKLLDKIDKLTTNFPRFVMLVGGRGSGKKLICNEIAKKLGYPLVSMGTGVDEVREVIQNSLDVLSDDKDKLIMDISIDDVPTSSTT